MSSTEPLPLLREQLVRLARHRIGDPHAAEDVAQETLARLLESRQTFTSAAHLTGWAVTTTKNLCADHHRQQRRLAWGAVEDLPGAWGSDQAADAFTLSRDLVEGILQALATMPERQAAVLLAAARLGSADRTALATATGETESAVRNYLHRGRAALRTRLAAAGQGAFGLQALRTFLRSGAHRRAITAGLLVPALSLVTALLGLPFHHDPAPTDRPTRSGRSEAVNFRPVRTMAALFGFAAPAAPTTRRRSDGAGWLTLLAGPTTLAGRELPVLLMTRRGDVCGVRAGDTVRAGRGDCGFDLSDETYVGVWAAGTGVGVTEGEVRCTLVPKVPGVVCIDPSTPAGRAAPPLVGPRPAAYA